MQIKTKEAASLVFVFVESIVHAASKGSHQLIQLYSIIYNYIQ